MAVKENTAEAKTAEAKSAEAKYYVYLLLCADGSYYCGSTNDPEKRLQAHNAGRGAKYTRPFSSILRVRISDAGVTVPPGV